MRPQNFGQSMANIFNDSQFRVGDAIRGTQYQIVIDMEIAHPLQEPT